MRAETFPSVPMEKDRAMWTPLPPLMANLTISGTITTFPNFAALEVVQGNLEINGITTAALINLNNIFPALDSVRGNLYIVNNSKVKTLSGFAELDSVGKGLRILDNNALNDHFGF